MKALVATRAAQSAAERTEFDCIEGELVWLVPPCSLSRRHPDGPCRCGRRFRGTFTDGESATAVVKDVPNLTRDDVVLALRSSHDGSAAGGDVFDAERVADRLIEIAARWPCGMVLERRVDRIVPRAFIPVDED